MVAPLVLVHPMWFTGEFWSPVLPLLGAPVATPTLPGFDGGSEPFTAEGAITRVRDALTACGAPADLVGLSMGARVALGVAARYPQLVRSLILLGVGTDCSWLRARLQVAAVRVFGRQIRANMGGTAPLAAARQALASFPDLPVSGSARVITRPTLVVAGGADRNYLASCQRIAREIPTAELTTIAGAHHLWPADLPGRFAELVEDWRAHQDAH